MVHYHQVQKVKKRDNHFKIVFCFGSPDLQVKILSISKYRKGEIFLFFFTVLQEFSGINLDLNY